MFDALLGGTPDRQVVGLDGGTQDIINKAIERSTNQDALKEANRGVEESGNKIAMPNQTGMAQNPGMLQAIRNQYSKLADKNIQKVIRQNQFNAPFMRQDQYGHGFDMAMASKQVQTQNFAMLQQANADSAIARAQALNGILTAGGMVGGAMLGGGGGGTKSEFRAQNPTGPRTSYSNNDYVQGDIRAGDGMF